MYQALRDQDTCEEGGQGACRPGADSSWNERALGRNFRGGRGRCAGEVDLPESEARDLNDEKNPRQRPRRRECLTEGLASKCQHPEVGMSLDYSRNEKKEVKQS